MVTPVLDGMPAAVPAALPRAAFLRRAYRLLPDGVRRMLAPLKAQIIQGRMLPPFDDTEAIPGITIAGLFSSTCGLGEGARLQAQALADLGVHVERLDLSPLLDPHPGLPALPADIPARTGPVIVHLNPPVFQDALRMLGRARLRGRSVIAYWAWELERAPLSWRAPARAATEIWAPSRFCADAIGAVLGRPVQVVPHPVMARAAPPDRAGLGLPDDRFLALTFVDLNSNMSRKNPFAAITAFCQAASAADMPPACLIIKLAGASAHPEQAARLREVAGTCPAPVIIIERPLSRAERDSLVASVDVLLSLHRSEGFGLTMAEAIAAGRHVIGTGWSGNLEFMTAANATLVPMRLVPVQDENSFYDRTLRWAEPDLDAAAAALRHLACARPQTGTSLPDLGLRFRAAMRDNAAITALLAR